MRSKFVRGDDPRITLDIGKWRNGYLLAKKGTSLNLPEDRYIWQLESSRKPSELDDIVDTYQFGDDPDLDRGLRKLPIIKFKRYYRERGSRYLGLIDDWWEGNDPPIPGFPNTFIGIVEGSSRVFFVDSSGYGYPRYMTEIIGFPLSQFISESLGFKRGEGPKRTLRIGEERFENIDDYAKFVIGRAGYDPGDFLLIMPEYLTSVYEIGELKSIFWDLLRMYPIIKQLLVIEDAISAIFYDNNQMDRSREMLQMVRDGKIQTLDEYIKIRSDSEKTATEEAKALLDKYLFLSDPLWDTCLSIIWMAEDLLSIGDQIDLIRPAIDKFIEDQKRMELSESSVKFQRGGDPRRTLEIGKYSNPLKIIDMEEEILYSGDRVTAETVIDDLVDTHMSYMDTAEIEHVLSNWEREAHPYYGFWIEEDGEPSWWHPSDVEGEVVEFNGKLYEIPISGKANPKNI